MLHYRADGSVEVPGGATQPPDEDLLGLMANGEAQALATLYDRYGRLVFSVALHITNDRLSAEEVTQDVFQIVWTQAHTFRPADGTPTGWLVGITRHRAIDEIRSHRSKMRQRECWLDDVPSAMMRHATEFEQQTVLQATLHTALGGMPAEQRRTLELTYYGGLTAGEVAAGLGIPLGTVKTRLRLGLMKLRALLLPDVESAQAMLEGGLPEPAALCEASA